MLSNFFAFSVYLNFKIGKYRVNCLRTQVNIIHSTSYQTQRTVQRRSCIETSPHRTYSNRIVMYYKSSRNEFYDMYFRTNFSIKPIFINDHRNEILVNSCCIMSYLVIFLLPLTFNFISYNFCFDNQNQSHSEIQTKETKQKNSEILTNVYE